MRFKKVIPSTQLSHVVKHFWFLDINQDDLPYAQESLPYGWFELFFFVNSSSKGIVEIKGERVVSAEACFTGQWSSSFWVNYSEPVQMVGISLQPWAGNILGVPANELRDRLSDFSDIDHSSRLEQRVIEAQDEKEILALLENYILLKLREYEADPLSASIVNSILSNPSNNSQEFFTTSGYSRRRVEQKFLASTGVSIGYYTRLSRFEAAVQRINSNPDEPLTSIAFDSGYYDQSHFIRDFRSFSGEAPRAFREKLEHLTEQEFLFLTD